MLKTMTVRATIAAILAGLSMAAHAIADSPKTVDIPAGDLRQALLMASEQFGTDLVFSPEQIQGFKTGGAHGQLTTEQAVTKLLEGTPLELRIDPSGAMLIVPPAAAKEAPQASSHSEHPKSFWSRFRLAQSSSSQGENRGELSRSEVTAAESGAAPQPQKRVEVEEVVVTAQKREERLHDVPVPVTAVDAQTLSDSNQLQLQNYYNEIPGLGLAMIGNANSPVVTIRGITTGGSTSPTVGIVIDDVPYGATVNPDNAPVVPDIDPGDLARIEVLRGPQGTLYGAASIGGLLKFVTIQPSTESFSGRLQAGFSGIRDSKDWGKSFRGSVNVPLSDSLAVRLSGFSAVDPGYIDNIQTGERDVDRRDSSGARLAALWEPTNDFSVQLSALFQNSDRYGAAHVDTALGGSPRHRGLQGTGGYERDNQAYSVILNGGLGAIDWTAITGYSVDDYVQTIDFSSALGSFADANFGVTGAGAPLSVQVKKFSQELRATIPVGERVSWLLGGFYTHEDSMSHLDLYAANSTTGARAGTLAINDQPSTFTEHALFTNLTIDITDRFDIQVGGRYSENEQTFSASRSGPLAGLLFSNVSIVPERNSEDDAFTYLVTPRYRFFPDLMAYARFASGYRPGRPNSFCGTPGIPCAVGPDTTESYEVGLKGEWFDGALSVDASVYYIDWQDIQVPLSILVAGIRPGYTDNASRARSQGVELALTATPLGGLKISGWVAFNDAELTEPFPPQSTVRGMPGDPLPYSSRYSGNFSIEQEFSVGNLATGYLGASVSYVGERLGLFRAATQARETFPEYTQVDLRAGLRFELWSLNAFVNNATDTRGILRSGLDSLSPTFVTYTQPRTAGLSLARTF